MSLSAQQTCSTWIACGHGDATRDSCVDSTVNSVAVRTTARSDRMMKSFWRPAVIGAAAIIMPPRGLMPAATAAVRLARPQVWSLVTHPPIEPAEG